MVARRQRASKGSHYQRRDRIRAFRVFRGQIYRSVTVQRGEKMNHGKHGKHGNPRFIGVLACAPAARVERFVL